MRVKKDGTGLNAAGAFVLVKEIPMQFVNEFQKTVGVAFVTLSMANSPASSMYLLRNVSTAGQIIRIGAAPNFTPGLEQGMVLYPGDAMTIEGITNPPFGAIADAAGGALAVSQWQVN